MSEQINKVLADRPQSFTTAEQLQARINIGAQASGDYAYNSAVSGVIDTVSSHSATWEQGGIDSATVSAIASSYAESAASSKLDASASSQFYLTSNPSSFVDSSYVDGAVSGKADASSLTAYALSSDVSGVIDTVSANSANWGDNGIDSATCSAIASSYAESAASSKLDASASSQFYLTSNPSAFISGVSHDLNLSGDGRTTQLGLAKKINIVDEYGNSAHLDPEAFSLIGDNNTPVFSADGHGVYVSGVAGNASSPYVTEYGLQGLSINGTDTYHGITATATFRYSGATLREGDDSALLKPTGLTLHTTAGDEVCDASSIVRWNSYSGKADGSSMSAYALSSDVSGVIDTVSANSASWGDNGVDSATVSAIASSYAESAVSSKADSSSLSSYAISADVSGVIDTVSSNSATWGGGAYLPLSATEAAVGSANTSTDISFAQGQQNGAGLESFAQGLYNDAGYGSFAQGSYSVAYSASFAQGLAQGGKNSAHSGSFAQGAANSASRLSFAQGRSGFAYDESFVQGQFNSASGGSFAQGNSNSASSMSFAQGGSNTASVCSFAQGGSNTANRWSFAQGNHLKANYTAAAFGTYNLACNSASSDPVAFVIGDGTPDARHDLLLITKDGEIRTYSSTADTTGFPIVSTLKSLSSTVAPLHVDTDGLTIAYNTLGNAGTTNHSFGPWRIQITKDAMADWDTLAAGSIHVKFGHSDFLDGSITAGSILDTQYYPWKGVNGSDDIIARTRWSFDGGYASGPAGGFELYLVSPQDSDNVARVCPSTMIARKFRLNCGINKSDWLECSIEPVYINTNTTVNTNAARLLIQVKYFYS